MKKTISIALGAVLLSATVASAAIIETPDMTGSGTFTLDAGDTWTNAPGTVAVGEQQTTVVNVNGAWIPGAGIEVNLGGVNWNAATDFTLNIGSAGSLTMSQGWIADGGPTYGGSVVINIAEGGTFSGDGSSFIRFHDVNGVWRNPTSSFEELWDLGLFKRDGLGKADLTAGVDDAFAQNFTTTNVNADAAFTLVAIPEPATLGLLGAFGGAILFIRRRFMI